jgi:hypothetical protein
MANLYATLYVWNLDGTPACRPTIYTKIEEAVYEFANYAWPNGEMEGVEEQICSIFKDGSTEGIETTTTSFKVVLKANLIEA